MTFFIDLGQARKDRLGFFRLFLPDALLQELLKEMVVTQPFPTRTNRQDKQIVLPDCFDQALPITLAKNCLA